MDGEKITGFLDAKQLVWREVDQFFGIERDEFPARIAEVAMWLMDHQMNLAVSEPFGRYFRRLPLKKAATIVHGDALRIDWGTVIRPRDLSYILGNPPISGYKYRTFQWNSEARGRAAVHCVIVGFAKEGAGLSASAAVIARGEATKQSVACSLQVASHGLLRSARNDEFPVRTARKKLIFDCETPKAESRAIEAKNINPYLVDAPDFLISRRTQPICPGPIMDYGSEPREGGFLILSDDERKKLIDSDPVTLAD